MITLKKLSYGPGLCLLILCSCREAKRPAPKASWDTYRKAYAFLSSRPDSAFYYFNEVVSASKDSQQVAMAYTNMGMIQSEAGDDFGAQESLLLSLKFLNEKDSKDHSSLVNDYNELGMTSFNLKNYDAAISFYDRALAATTDEQLKLVILNNKANAYREQKAYGPALNLYKTITGQTKKEGTAYARALTNMAATRWLSDPRYDAAPELLKALAIRVKEKDQWGQNSSFAHLADYYARSHPDSALNYARRLYATAQLLQSPDNRLDALEKLVRLATPKESRAFFVKYRELGDSIQAARNAAKNQFALIRYNVQKERADKLKLQKDNTEKNYQIDRQRLIITGCLALILSGTSFIRFWFRKRKQQTEMKAQQAIRESELKTSKKVHDVVANGLYRIMKEVETRQDLDKATLLDNIDHLYERSRDISYEGQTAQAIPFHERLATMLNSFATDQIRVLSAGNTESLWEHTNSTQQDELWHILQELMVNMRKHSQAANVALRFNAGNKKIAVHYTDDGTGIRGTLKKKNGLRNTGNRIKDIGGELIFDTSQEKGLKIHISFPVI
ncbi:signal transduction histidine kinase [Mucilaginibacter oryzae]|uniref:histidine kinase n=1 Tax=Mucilaginibacter oryzae TaxID=468058 RepID=A0A316GWW8_9SPHI|nr:tetratricopeptide repeat-containing sensor histidine kinase [Mucilaginibacter oryzae]PWK68322.1 signal transduction histidine kinase [Mucilaginibacter oryzae]